jgi:hypothetical protein
MRYGALVLFSSALLLAETFAPDQVAILGDIDYDRTAESQECTGKQKYCSLLFNGMSGDRIQVAVTGGAGSAKAFVAIADGSLKQLAQGSGEVGMTLPEVTDKLATYYIVFRDQDGKAGRFTIKLSKGK